MGVIKNIINGTYIQNVTARRMKLIVFCAVLLLIYIAFRYEYEGQLRNISRLSREISDIQSKLVETKKEYQETISLQSLNTRLSSRGVGISDETVKEIIIVE